MSLVHKNPFIPKDVFDLFPTVETIECDYEDVFNGRKDSILKKAKKLRVIYEGSDEETTYIDSKYMKVCFRKRIESIKIHIRRKHNCFQFYPNHYPNLKKVVLLDVRDLKSFFKEKYLNS